MQPERGDIERLLSGLAATEARISGATRGLSDDSCASKPDASTWSVNDNLAHLRACADVYARMIERMLLEDVPVIRWVSPRTYIRRTDYPQRAFQASFAEFSAQRDALLGRLGALTPEQWARQANLKLSYEVQRPQQPPTPFLVARGVLHHETVHCTQIEELLGLPVGTNLLSRPARQSPRAARS